MVTVHDPSMHRGLHSQQGEADFQMLLWGLKSGIGRIGNAPKVAGHGEAS